LGRANYEPQGDILSIRIKNMNIVELEKQLFDLSEEEFTEYIEYQCFEGETLEQVLSWNPQGSESPEGVGIAHPA
jgi:hypothetical protein